MQRRLPAYRSNVALALLCCCVSRAVASMDAPAVRTLTFRGLSALSARDVRSWMATAEGTLFSQTRLEEDLRHVVERCRGMGYLAAAAAVAETRFAPDSSWVDLTVDVAEGKVTLVGRVSVRGMTAMDGLPEDFETREGQPMSASRLEQDIGVLLERYERMGYAFAQGLRDDAKQLGVVLPVLRARILPGSQRPRAALLELIGHVRGSELAERVWSVHRRIHCGAGARTDFHLLGKGGNQSHRP